jgi:two-component system sensor histidine kinase UhpB
VSLRLQINLVITALMLIWLAVVGYLEIDNARRSVKEETEAASRVASQLLWQIARGYDRAELEALVFFLQRVGRVRGNEIRLLDAEGTLLYESPPSPYKQGREAPGWFVRLIAPTTEVKQMHVGQGTLLVEPNFSRSVLDSWDDLRLIIGAGAAIFVLANVAVFWIAGRALKPLGQVVEGLKRLGEGAYATRLPPLPGREVQLISATFNRMAQAVEESITVKREAQQTAHNLARSRELTQLIQAQVEEERRFIARELHDEIGQSVTAIKSMALSIAQRSEGGDPKTEGAARLIAETAGRIYDVMHQMIPRLRPLALDNLGLAEALGDLMNELRLQHPETGFTLEVGELPADLGDTVRISAYRIVQESLTNAIRHAGGKHVAVELQREASSLCIRIDDDGRGLGPDWDRPGHYGVRGMRERAESLGGELRLERSPSGGVRVSVRLPIG